jgi:dihydroorotate dehydrogenase (NAD+) catalytic subunit
VTLINTLPGMAVDVRSRSSRLGGITGGLSGPAIKPVAIYWIYRVAEELKIPVIGVGGISGYEDALEFIIAGASAVQIGTANFVDPTTSLEVIDGMREFCEAEGIERLASLVHSLDLQESPDGNQTAE